MATVTKRLEIESYVPTDSFFGAPYIDRDEERDDPLPHRHVHGGFTGTDTKFTLYFPTDGSYQGRLINPLAGAHGGHEESFGPGTAMGELAGGLPMTSRLGGYLVESNQGHIGDDLDPKGGDDPTLYGHRASAEVARFSKHIAAQVYGEPPHHSYVWGGSGGGRRSPLCLENAPDAWDGAMPFVGGGPIVKHGSTEKIQGAQVMSFATMFNCQRILGPKISEIADAMAPGGAGNPFEGLSTHQREELASLYMQGYPRGDEFMIGQPMGQMWLWTSMADSLVEQDPTYFENFWTKPGYVGHDHPEHVAADLIDIRATVSRILTAAEVLEDPKFTAPEYQNLRMTIAIMSGLAGGDQPMLAEVEGVGTGYRPGTGLRILSGQAAGRQLYTMQAVGDVFFCDGVGEANLLRFNGVLAGDEVHVSNRNFLAFCYFARHHLMDEPQFDHLRIDGRPIYPQHPVPLQSALMGVGYSGQYRGKLLWLHHTHDSSLWPHQGIVYRDAVQRAQGDDGSKERFRLRWTEHAEHGPAFMVPSMPNRASHTWLIDYSPVLEQSLLDLFAWVEQGVEPAGTNFEWAGSRVYLPDDAKERGGIQPVISVTANGQARAEVRVGEPVTLELNAEVPPGAGTIIAAEWDFDGTGSFPFQHPDVDGTSASVTRTTTHSFERPGTFFVTGRVYSHRSGDVSADSCRIPNVGQARVVVV